MSKEQFIEYLRAMQFETVNTFDINVTINGVWVTIKGSNV